MAVVYDVVDESSGSRRALKVLTAPGTSVRQRMLREGRMQSRLQHPNVVSVTDVVDVDGTPALVLEHVAGPSLDAMLRVDRLTLDEADAIAGDVLAGVAAAHAEGFVHRDLKPSNVLLAPAGTVLVAKVSDFGLAKAVGAERLDSLDTRTGGLLGTLLYMAPEQIRDPRLADARSDVFALGALLHELVTGTRCFAGVDMVDIVHRVTTATRAKLPPGAPGRMAAAIDAALRVDPTERPADAGALLARWRDGRAPGASPWSADRVAEIAELYRPRTLPGQDRRGHADFPGRQTLPPEPNAFVGRVSELLELDRLLGEGPRAIAVVGASGTGRTRLVTHHARTRGARWSGGAWFAGLAAARTSEDVLSGVASALGVPLGHGDDVDRVGAAIAARGPCVLVLDDFEPARTDVGALVVRWLARAPEARLVLTCRSTPALPAVAPLHLEPLDPIAAVALFVERGAAAKPGFTLAPEERAVVADLVELLDRLPLAIELAAARVRGMPPATLLAGMSDRFRALRAAGERSPEATLRATLDWGWDLLSADERRGLAQLSAFAGAFDLSAAEGVLALDEAWPEDVVQALTEKGLVRATEYRFELPPGVRAYAAGKRADVSGD